MNNDQPEQIFVTRPDLPPLEELISYLKAIWDTRLLTNNGPFHAEFEKALCRKFNIPYCSLFTNGTMALQTVLQGLRITGEVITTPYTFAATTHSLYWNHCTPVFCDIDKTYNIDPSKIESLITPNTTAILAVNIYGIPCDFENISKIADLYGLKVIYDAAHSFGVSKNGISSFVHGDASVTSFHATKVFNTFEGGVMFTHSKTLKDRVDFLKNFGFANEVTVVAPGTNAKMNEFQAALGLLQLKYFDEKVEKRKKINEMYHQFLGDIPGISFLKIPETLIYNYAYMPIFIDSKKAHFSRDQAYTELRKNNIVARRYFYPLVSAFPTYRHLPSSTEQNLRVAHKASNTVLSLPIFTDLQETVIARISDILHRLHSG